MTMTTKLQCVRCPTCKGDTCGWDAYSSYNPVTQKTELAGEYDHGWSSECGDVAPEYYTPEGQELADLQREIALATGPDLRAQTLACMLAAVGAP